MDFKMSKDKRAQLTAAIRAEQKRIAQRERLAHQQRLEGRGVKLKAQDTSAGYFTEAERLSEGQLSVSEKARRMADAPAPTGIVASSDGRTRCTPSPG